jgi:hypothetical protein
MKKPRNKKGETDDREKGGTPKKERNRANQ